MNTRVAKASLSLCSFCAALALQPLAIGHQAPTPVHPAAPVAQQLSFIFKRAGEVIQRESLVPLRLPTFLPDDISEKNPVYATLRSVSRTGYDIVLEFQPDCGGADACFYAELKGSSTPIVEETEVAKVPVTLQGGIKGYFIDFTCAANCGESYVGWSEGGYYYSIGMKAEKMQTLVKVANSAIASGQGQKR